MQCPCFKCKYAEQLNSKTIKRRSTTLRLIESIPGIPMYVWKQNIVWFLVNTESEASSDEVFRLFERQKPLPFDWVPYCHFHSMKYIVFFIQGLPEPWAILSIEHYCKSWECINKKPLRGKLGSSVLYQIHFLSFGMQCACSSGAAFVCKCALMCPTLPYHCQTISLVGWSTVIKEGAVGHTYIWKPSPTHCISCVVCKYCIR